jgi:transposase
MESARIAAARTATSFSLPTRCKKRTNVWRKACRQVGLLHKHVFHQRHDFQPKLWREIVNNNGIIVVEDLKVKGLGQKQTSQVGTRRRVVGIPCKTSVQG